MLVFRSYPGWIDALILLRPEHFPDLIKQKLWLAVNSSRNAQLVTALSTSTRGHDREPAPDADAPVHSARQEGTKSEAAECEGIFAAAETGDKGQMDWNFARPLNAVRHN